MRSATASSMPHAATAPIHRTNQGLRIGFSDQEEKLLNLNLSDLAIPKMNDLHVDGLNKRSLLSRLFGGRWFEPGWFPDNTSMMLVLFFATAIHRHPSDNIKLLISRAADAPSKPGPRSVPKAKLKN